MRVAYGLGIRSVFLRLFYPSLRLICLSFSFDSIVRCSRLSSDADIKFTRVERPRGVTLCLDFSLDLARRVQASVHLDLEYAIIMFK